MTVSRLAPWLLAALLTCTIALWVTADASSTPDGEPPAEAKAFAQLAAVAAAHGHAIPDGLARYAHHGDAAIAHAPLDGIAGYGDADFATGVLIMAVVIEEPPAGRPGRVPSGAYVVQVKLDPATHDGTATYFDGHGAAVAHVAAHARARDELAGRFPASLPVRGGGVTTTQIWQDGSYVIASAGWQADRVIYY